MPKTSAGIMMWKWDGGLLRVLLVHPGGPFWEKKDLGAWSIPKGEYRASQDPLEVARGEFEEELGTSIEGQFRPLGDIKQKAGKVVTAFAIEGDFDVRSLRSNTFEIEWPPKSGMQEIFVEVDRAAWFTIEEARLKINPGQAEFLNRLTVFTG